MTLGWRERVPGPRVRTHYLPRRSGEGGAAYAARFFREVAGLGRVDLVRLRGRRHRVVTRRGW